MPIADVKKAFEALKAKQAPYSKFFRYYDGDQPLMYTASRLNKIFKGLDAKFQQNWCAVVVDSTKNRINLRAVRVPSAQEGLWKELWLSSELNLESDDCHEGALVSGEGFMIVDNDGQAYYNDPRLVHIFYDPARPRVKSWAAKWWVAEDGKLRMTLYYADKIENYVSKGKADNTRNAASIEAMKGNDKVIKNPLNVVPVFHFRKSRRAIRGELVNVVPVQNQINKLIADMMVAGEFGAAKQRWIISNMESNGQFKNAPDEIWDIPAGDGTGQQTQVGQFEHTPLDNYLKPIEQASGAVSSITGTPKHYFFSIGSNLSGESLTTMENPLVKKAQDWIDRFEPTWQNVASLMLKAKGQEVSPSAIEAEFDKPEVVQPRAVAETRQMNTTAGMPLTTQLRDEGKDKAYIEQMLADKQAEADLQNQSLAQNLLNAKRRMDKGG